MKVEIKNTKTITVPYTDITNHECYVTVVEWENGEGCDVTVEEKGNTQMFQLNNSSYMAISIALGMLELDFGK